MKVLMITPPSGGLNVYTKPLVKAIQSKGIDIDTAGSKLEDFPYIVNEKKWKSSKWVRQRVERIVDNIDFSKYDIVAFHYGKNDIEQYIPVVLMRRGIKLKSVYFVHYLSRNIFEQFLNDKETNKLVEDAVYNFFNGYVFYGEFAKKYMEMKSGKSLKGIVSYYPEAHSKEIISKKEQSQFKKAFTFKPVNLSSIYILGYASNYKDSEILINSLSYIHVPFKLIFAGRGWQKRIGFQKKKINNVFVEIIDRELNSKEFKFLCQESKFGIFPYRQPKLKDEVFQGSGVLPNYIFNNKACIVFNEGCMREYVKDGGIVINKPTPIALARQIESLFQPSIRKSLEENTKKHSYLFSIENHSKDCIKYFESLL